MILIRNTANCDFGQKLLKDIKELKRIFLLITSFLKTKTHHQRQDKIQ